MPFPDNVAFCCLALDEAYLHPGGSIRVDHELQVSAEPPVDLDETWVRWLGTIQARAFRDSSLVLTAQRPIPRFGVVAPYEVEHRVRLLHLCLLLQGCANAPGGLIVGGNTENGHLHVGPLGPFESYPRPEYRRFTRTTAERIADAAALLPGAELVYGGGDAPFRPYRRLRLGFNSWIFGLRSLHVDHRLHWFVRALEAFLKVPRYGITRAFKDRGQELIGASQRNEKLLEQLYDLRSCVEHVKSFQNELRKPRGIEREAAFAFWSLCAELLAGEVYKRILRNRALIDCFRDEITAAGFWRRSPLRRTELFGDPINILSLARQQLRQSRPEEWL